MNEGEALSNIPGWAGYNSLLSESKPITQLGAPGCTSLQMLSTEADVTETMLGNLASFVCAAYSAKGTKSIFELRRHLFLQAYGRK